MHHFQDQIVEILSTPSSFILHNDLMGFGAFYLVLIIDLVRAFLFENHLLFITWKKLLINISLRLCYSISPGIVVRLLLSSDYHSWIELLCFQR